MSQTIQNYDQSGNLLGPIGGVASITGDGTVTNNSTSTGAVTLTLATHSANTLLAGPTTGAAAAPTFRALVGADLPNPSATTLGGIESYVAVTNQWINAISTTGVPSSTQPAFSNLSGTLALTQFPAVASADIIVGNAGGTASIVAMSGDVSINNTGTTTVGSIGGKAVSLGGSVTFSGAFATTLNVTAGTTLTLPTTGTLATLANLTSALPVSTGALLGNDATAGQANTVAIGAGVTLSSGTLSAGGSGGTVTSVATGAGLTGGPVTTSGTISFATIAANSFLMNATGSTAVPTATPFNSTIVDTSGTVGINPTLSLSSLTVTGTFTATGLVTNADLTNSSLTIGSTNIALGSTVSTFGGVTLTSPTFTTPALGTPASGTLTNCTGLPNGGLVNSSVTVGTTGIALGAAATTIAGLTSLSSATINATGSLVVGSQTITSFTGTNLSISSGTLNAAGSSGVSSITAGTGLAASPSSPITTSGTLSLATIAANTLLMNTTAGTAVPTATPIGVSLIDTSGTLAVNPALVLTTPTLGTPASGTLTNCTGLPTTGLTGTLQAAQFPALTGDVTNTAGSLSLTVGSIGGKAVSLGGAVTFSGAFATTLNVTASTTLTLPTSGTLLTTTGSGAGLTGVVTTFSAGTTGLTPSSGTSGAVTLAGTLAAANGGTGLGALGTGVATALGSNVNAASGFVTFSGALGTPTSGTLTSCTGLPTTGLTGTLQAAQFPALTGDITTTAGALATTLATVNSSVGSFGSATAASTFTVNGKGLLTAAGSVTITPAIGSVTGLGTGVATALALATNATGGVVTMATASGTNGVAIGSTSTASSTGSVAIGVGNTSSAAGSIALGAGAVDRGILGTVAYSAAASAVGQRVTQLLVGTSTAGTSIRLTANGSAATTNNVLNLPSSVAMSAIMLVTARNTANGDKASWQTPIMYCNQGGTIIVDSPGTLALPADIVGVGSTASTSSTMAGALMTVTADQTNLGVNITIAPGAAGGTIVMHCAASLFGNQVS